MATKKIEVTMINSVGEHVAGKKVKLDPELADRYIAMGYAEGTPSREITDKERKALKAEQQKVVI